MFVAWDPGPVDPPPGVLDVTIDRDDRRVSMWSGGVEYAWNAGNQWRIPVMDIPDAVWSQLPMVGELALIDDDGAPVGDGSLPAVRPEAT